jgi:hypothetical protein
VTQRYAEGSRLVDEIIDQARRVNHSEPPCSGAAPLLHVDLVIDVSNAFDLTHRIGRHITLVGAANRTLKRHPTVVNPNAHRSIGEGGNPTQRFPAPILGLEVRSRHNRNR